MWLMNSATKIASCQAKLFQFFNDRKLSVGLYGKVQEVLDKAPESGLNIGALIIRIGVLLKGSIRVTKWLLKWV